MAIHIPTLRGERLIIAALFMILIAECIASFLKLEKMRIILETLGFLFLTFSLITTGVRANRAKWPSFKGISMIVIGLGICSIPLFAIHAHNKMNKTLVYKPDFEKMQAALVKNDLPLKSKIRLSKMFAHDKYLYEGTIVSYLTEADERNYVPTKEDIEFWNTKATTTQQWINLGERFTTAFWTWTGIAAISLLVGVLSPIQKITPNSRSDHDRA